MFEKLLRQIAIASVVWFTGCGEENFSAGVSIGGSGSGNNTSAGPGPISPLPSTGDEDEKQERFVVWAPLDNTSDCNPLEISYHVLNKTTNQIIPNGYGTDLSYIDSDDLHNLQLQVHIKNSSSSVIYQYNEDCQSGFTLLDEDLIPFNKNIEIFCNQNESIQTYKPYEQKIFNLKYNLISKEQIWTINYKTFFSIDNIVKRDDYQTCEGEAIPLMIEKM